MYLYRTEVKGIQAWILGSGKLREIAGASQVIFELADLVRECAGSCNAHEVVQAAAGGATLRFASIEELRSFAKWWPVAVSRRAPGLSVVQAWVNEETSSWTDLHRRLAEARNRHFPDLPEAGPLIARAGRTGLPAVDRDLNGTRDRGSVAALASFRQSGRRRIRDVLLPGEPHRFVENLDELPEGYLATIHADANGIGKLIAGDVVEDKGAFSKALKEATEESARRAIRGLPRDASKVHCRPIVLGGDDFTVIVPAREALTFAREYLTAFEEETQRRSRELASKLTACAGIAITKPGWPFHDSHELAESLCSAAKASFRESGLSGVAFHRVTTALSSDWEDIVRGPLAGAGTGRSITANPFSLEDLDLLEVLATVARGLPRGSLRQWVTLARVDLARAQEHWERLGEVARLSTPDLLDRFGRALEDLGCDPTTGWARDGRSSPIFDALEWHQWTKKPKKEVA